jgi:hypothetical protein
MKSDLSSILPFILFLAILAFAVVMERRSTNRNRKANEKWWKDHRDRERHEWLVRAEIAGYSLYPGETEDELLTRFKRDKFGDIYADEPSSSLQPQRQSRPVSKKAG